MLINWSQFSPWQALLGGAMIGLAATLLILLNGRVLGVSGILGGLHQAKAGWRFAFLAGLLAAPFLYQLFVSMPSTVLDASDMRIAVSGLLVGFGTRLASGCTSGHGVCGLARGSVRSLVAVLCFMSSGMLCVFLLHHLVNWH